MIKRVKENKSLADIRLTTGTCREFFQNDRAKLRKNFCENIRNFRGKKKCPLRQGR